MQKIKNNLPAVARILLGLVFFVFGLNGFLGFLPQPALPEPAGAFFGALAATGYMLPMVKLVEVVFGLALLVNRFVPLALTVLAPIIINIAAFHAVLAPVNMGMVVFLLAAEIYLAWSYRDAFRGVLQGSAKPRVASATAVHGEVSRSAA